MRLLFVFCLSVSLGLAASPDVEAQLARMLAAHPGRQWSHVALDATFGTGDQFFADDRSDETTDLVNPSTGSVVAQAPVSSAEDVAAAYAAAATAFQEWGQSTPSERQQALLKIADEIEDRASEFISLEAENTGKPHALTASEEIPPMLDQLRFFAGAARVLEGKSAGEYMSGHTSWIRREPLLRSRR